MKKIITLLLLLIAFNISAQLPYTWTANVDPGWTSTNPGFGGALTWRSCNFVTTNCSSTYSNFQNTYYTSPTINC